MSAPPFRAGGSTTIGVHPQRRANDDFLLLDNDLGLFAVFDGGGCWFGDPEQTNRLSAAALQRVIREGLSAEPRKLIERAFRTATESLLAEPEESCGSCSVSLVLFRTGRAHISWLGDAMASRVTGDHIEPLTSPHTVWNEMVRQGQTPASPSYRKLLCHVLGISQLPDPLEIVSFAPQPGDRLILATDGVTDHIALDTILNTCRVISDPTTCAEAIIEHAIMAGSRDNCTCAVIAFRERDFR